MSGGLNGVVWGTIQSRDVVKSSNEACNPSPYQTAHHHPANPLPPLSLSLVLAANQALELRLHLAETPLFPSINSSARPLISQANGFGSITPRKSH